MKKQLLFLLVFFTFHNIYAQLTATLTVIQATCVQNDGSVTINATGGTAPYQYAVDVFDQFHSSNFFTNLAPGNHTVIVQDALGYYVQLNFTITVPAPITAVATTSNVLCAGMNNGSIIISTIGGTAPYSYSLNGVPLIVGPQATNVFTGLPAGNYAIAVTDSGGCMYTTTVMISQPAPLLASLTVFGNTISVGAMGGVAPYQYSIDEGVSYQASSVFSNLTPAVIYSVVVRDANGCVVVNQADITTNPEYHVTIYQTLDIPTSGLFANVSGGVAPYLYQWYKDNVLIAGATNQDLNVYGQFGTFSVIVTDANNFTTSNSIYVQGVITPVANDDTFTVYPVTGSTSIAGNVLSNDSVNSPMTFALQPLTIPTGFNLYPDGTIGVLSGTPVGTYTLTYKLCNGSDPTSCDTATVIITVAYEAIRLNAFIDTNNNGTQETGEHDFANGQFGYELNDSGTVNYVTSSNGEYVINEPNQTNSYDLTYTINPAFASQYTASTSYSNINIVSNSGMITYDFPVTEIPFVETAVYIYQNGAPPRPGFTYTNQILYKNNGNQTIASGTVTFTKDNAVSINSVSQAGITNTATGFTYDFTNLLAGETRYINVIMQVPTIPTVNLGNVFTNTAAITMPMGDINTLNNNATLSQVVVGSYDPNDKSEAHGGKILHSAFTSNDYLTYTIQFENTGTANAENVRVNDVLDAKLDETSIRMVDASHEYVLERNGNELNWNFNGIELTPSEKGYINFQVKPKAGYAVGDIIPNTADIYFDFNPAIVTNTFNTEFVAFLSVAEFDNNDFTAYPNPTNGQLTIALKNNTAVINAVTVNDVLGKTVQTKTFNASNAVLDLSNLTKGIYFVKVQSEGQEKVMKIVKQ